MISSRRYDLDWVRVIAFGILIYFHSAIIFVPDAIPMIHNDDSSALIQWFVSFSSQFRLALLFMVSGVGVAFARSKRTSKEFVAERSKRLLIPFIVGFLFVVPLTIYFERLHLNEFSGSFLAFYPSIFTTGIYPEGNLSWHHLWFIAYLYLFCLLGLKCFTWFDSAKGQDWLDRLEARAKSYRIYEFILVLLIFEIPLRVFYPGFRDLIHDWANFVLWFLIFLAGYVIAKRESLLNEITAMRSISLLAAVVSTSLLFGVFYEKGDFLLEITDPNIVVKYLCYCLLRISMIWFCLLTCLGYAGKYLRFSNRILTYLNEAIYPLFIMHLPIIAMLGYFVTPLDWLIATKFLLITSATILICLVLYQLLIKPYNLMRLLFGVKSKQPRMISIPAEVG